MNKSKINTIVRNIIHEVSKEFNLGELTVKMGDTFPWSLEFEFTGEDFPTKALTVRFSESKENYTVSRSIHSPSTDLSDTVQQVVVGRIAERILQNNIKPVKTDDYDTDNEGNCIYCGAKCFDGEMCDEQQAGGFNNPIK